MQIALIVDGLESTRQFYADSGSAIVRAGKEAFDQHPNVEFQTYRDGQVDNLFAELDYSDVRAIIITSNSLRHKEGRVVQSLNANKEKLGEFLRKGGGLLILHQFTDGEALIQLPNGLEIVYRKVSVGTVRPLELLHDSYEADYLLNFPNHIDHSNFVLGTDRLAGDEGQLTELVSWMAIDGHSLEGLEPVIRSANGETLLARSSDAFQWRVVVSAIPLDWHDSTTILANIIRFIAIGKPLAIVWPGPSESSVVPLSQALIQFPSTYFVKEKAGTGPNLEWLQTIPVFHLLPATMEVNDQKLIHRVTRRGGLALSIGTHQDEHSTTFSGVVGNRQSEIVEDYFRTMAASSEGAPSNREPFPLRNVVLAARYFSENYKDRDKLWNPKNQDFVASLSELIYPGITFTSLLAVMQIVAGADAPISRLHEVISALRTLSSRSEGETCLMIACAVVTGESIFDDFLEAILPIAAVDLDQVLVIRLLDWIGFLHFTLGRTAKSELMRNVLEKLLSGTSSLRKAGFWLSLEGTTSAVLGICAASSIIGESDVLDAAFSAVMTLRQANENRSSAQEEMNLEVRILHSLAIAENFAPLVLDQIAARISAVASQIQGTASDKELSASERQSSLLAIRNRKLSEELQSLTTDTRRLHPVMLAGSISLWSLYILTIASLAFVEIWIISQRYLLIAPMSLLLAVFWLWASVMLLRLLERVDLVPRWSSALLRQIPKVSKWFPEAPHNQGS